MVDRYTKIVLTIIALALTVIALNPWIAPTDAEAARHEYLVSQIAEHVRRIAQGTCTNFKICG